MNSIFNYIKVNENISTSGQPTIDEFEQIKNNNFEIVINLALCNSSNSLENEDKIVTNLGMNYFHLPVDFDKPNITTLKTFLSLMDTFYDKKIFVHCAKNYRVTAFMYVYHKYFLKTPFEDIDLSLLEEWSPNKTWQDIIKIDISELS